MTSIALPEIVAYLDAFLRVSEVPDDPNAVNGLQVENDGSVDRIIAAVDASLETIQGITLGDGVRTASPLLLVHHGLHWDGNQPTIGRRYQKLRRLFSQNAALYAAHIPLDVHPEVGNNWVLSRQLGLSEPTWFDSYKGAPMGVKGVLAIPREELANRLETLLGCSARIVPGGPPRTRQIGIITGAAGGRVRAAKEAGIDTFVTGEGAHHTYFDAMELGINLIYAGHYATEQVGVKALAAHLSARFDLPWEFHHHPTGM